MTFAGKDIAIIGFGLEGQAMADFLIKEGARVMVCDEREDLEHTEAFETRRGQDIRWQCGEAYLKGIEKFPIIVRSPGFPLSHPALRRATSKGAEVTSLTKIFFDRCPAPIIGITGTKGKGTTSTLIYEMLKRSRKTVHLVGNIGVPAITVLPKIKKTDWVVFELSSYQLQDMTVSPTIAVVLGLTVDHQDHHKSPREYYEAKSSIVKFQKPHDAAIFMVDYPETKRFEAYARGRIFETSRHHGVKNGTYAMGDVVLREMYGKTEEIVHRKDIKLKGEHNLENVSAAVTAATLAGASLPGIRSALKSFAGLPNRLELVATVNGVEYWNSSYGTTPETTVAAARAFTEPIILMLGGSEKNHDYTAMGEALVDTTVKVVVGIGMTAPKMHDAIKKAAKAADKQAPIFIEGGPTMKTMMAAARKFAKPGDVILLAPGAASFDRFKNYTDRGNLFREAAQTTKR